MLVEPVSLSTLVVRGNTYAHLQEETPDPSCAWKVHMFY